MWNKLPTDCVQVSSVMFKNTIDKYLVKADFELPQDATKYKYTQACC